MLRCGLEWESVQLHVGWKRQETMEKYVGRAFKNICNVERSITEGKPITRCSKTLIYLDQAKD